MYKRFVKPVLIYASGLLFWMVLISVLENTCVLNVTTIVDGLWTQKINEYFVENVTGAIAFDASGYGCDGRYIYKAKYCPGNQYDAFETQSLTSVVDIGSWRRIERSGVATTYADCNHKYVVKQTSDGVAMDIFDK